MKKMSILLIASLFSFQAMAAEDKDSGTKTIDFDQLYVGGGLGFNDAFSDNAIGFQIFAGVPINNVDLGDFKLSVEVGYMNSGDFDQTVGTVTSSASASGLWSTAVFEKTINEKLDFLARIGLDIGDDDGIMFGFGVAHQLNPKSDIRVEYVIRDTINSLQANYVYRLK